jgi:transcriptional regulator
MLDNPLYASDDAELVRKLIAENPWATVVSATGAGLVASHYPVLLADGSKLAVLMHVGRPDENQDLLVRLTAHLERYVEDPVQLDTGIRTRLGPGTIGFRIPIERFICKVKMSQDEEPNTQLQIQAALRRPGPYSNPALADQMAATLEHAARHGALQEHKPKQA